MNNPIDPDLEVEAALAVLSVIEKAISEWRNMKAGIVHPEEVITRLNSFTQGIDANDKAADAALAKKHP